MALTILSVTNHLSGTARVFLQTAGAAMAQVQSDAWTYQRTAINPADPDQMAVAGFRSSDGLIKVLYSLDGGDNWQSFSYAATDEVRQLQWRAVDELVIASKDLLCVADNFGGVINTTFLESSFNGSQIMDTYWKSSTEGYALQNLLVSGGYLYYTTDGGSTWDEKDLTELQGWGSTESPRRITPRVPWSGVLEILLLSSHVLYRATHNANLSTFSDTAIWAFEQDLILADYPSFPATGYVASDDWNTRFDDLEIRDSRLWLGGFNGLRAHSFNLLDFYLTDLGTINSFGDLDNAWFHQHTTISELYVGSTMPSETALPYRPGLNYSVDGGISHSPYFLFPEGQRMAHFDLFAEDPTIGCTDPDACNYIEGLDLDDNTCQRAVQLRNCLTNTIIHSNNPDIVALGCRGPRVMLNIASLNPAEEIVSIQVFINAVLVLTYSATISTGDLPMDRLNEFIQGFIAYVNANGYRARLVPVAENTLVPGSTTGIWITSLDNDHAGETVSINTSFVNATAETVMDGGLSGNVVSVLQYPGQCFTVCGQGDCAQVQVLDLVSSFADCVSCAISPSGRLCIDCGSTAFVGGIALVPNSSVEQPNCVYQGNVIDLYLRATFPNRQNDSFNVVSGGLCGNCPIVLVLQGNKTLFFPPGSQFTDEPDENTYTVSASTYDSNTDQTTIVTVENCQGEDTLTSVVPFINCACRVRVLLERWENDVWLGVSDVTYPCENLQVFQDLQLPIDVQGIHRLQVIASDCAETRTCIYHMAACGAYEVVETACHSFEVRSAGLITGNNAIRVTITNLLDNSIRFNENVLIGDLPLTFTNSDAEDAIYLVEVTGPDARVWRTEMFDICNLAACRLALTMAMWCEEDPCTATMSQEETLSRLELSRISLLISQLNAEVFTYRYRWTGIPEYNAERTANLGRIAALIKTAHKLSERCGECTKKAAPCHDC
jgi:hypothetical protein